MKTLVNDHYFVGSPVWGCAEYKGSVFPAKAAKATWLGHYSKMFNTVEGNSTFYGIPTRSTFERWGAETDSGFRFALKFPRAVSHEKMLLGVDEEMDLFLDGLEALAEAYRLGPTFLQLGPSFGPDRLQVLSQFLTALPKGFPYAVEVRHHDLSLIHI